MLVRIDETTYQGGTNGPEHPMVGESATYTATGTDTYPAGEDTYTFTWDGPDNFPFPAQEGSDNTWTTPTFQTCSSTSTPRPAARATRIAVAAP